MYPADAGTPAVTTANDQPLKWKARPFLSTVAGGVYDMRARWWSPRLGAFVQADSFGYLGAKSTLWSWWNQNPVRYRDPSGRRPDTDDAAEAYQAAYESAYAQDPSGTQLIAGVGVAGAGLALAGPIEALAFEGYAGLAPILGPALAAALGTDGGGGEGGAGNPEVSAAVEDAEGAVCGGPGAPNASGLSGDALVCRGGTCTAGRFSGGTGVTLDANGQLQGVSVNSAENASVQELSAGIPNNQVGVSTVGDVRALGGDVVSSPTSNNPFHATLSGITPDQAEQLFTPTVPNPNR